MPTRDNEDLLIQTLGASSFGFVDLRNNDLRSLGSATLIRFGNNAGFLTCAHVLDKLRDAEEFGLVCFRRRERDNQSIRIRFAHCNAVQIGGSAGRAGPDLGFLQLAHADLARLSGFATVENGDMRAEAAALRAPACDRFFDVVVGVVAEWTDRTIDTPEVLRVEFNSLANIGHCVPATGAEGFDFAAFTPHPEQGFTLPGSYGGTSGGGWWRFYLRGDHLVEARLLGVAYYQEEDKIICHGPASIYNSLRRKITEKLGVD